MSDTINAVPAASRKDQLSAVENVRDLFARAHDLIAQASHPGHMGMKVAEVLNFLKFHYEDFKQRGELLAKQIEGEVDVQAAKAATKAVLEPETAQEAPQK